MFTKVRNVIAKSLLILITSVIVFSLNVSAAQAGKGAVTYACVNLAVKPTSKVSFNFSPNIMKCMNNEGISETLVVEDAGVDCVSVGYVEAKGSNTCAFRDSKWSLSYTTSGQAWNGSTQSIWSIDGIALEGYSPKTSVNLSPAVSNATSTNWDGTGPIYIIFTPGAS